LAGIILNAILPGKDYVFEDKQQASQGKAKMMETKPIDEEEDAKPAEKKPAQNKSKKKKRK
ncbi:MAG: hypothetical protein IKI38_01875, partial [Mogibacterium sp.]|nr:hypothetical protein [Mogibacterium sp.]